MSKYPKYKYEFKLDEEKFFLPIGATVKFNYDEDEVKVCKFTKGFGEQELMNLLWISINGGVWFALEQGRRTPTGKFREDFKRFKIKYSSNTNEEWKDEEIFLQTKPIN